MELRPAVGQNANGRAYREECDLEAAVLCRAIAAPTAIGNRAEHTNFISTTLQRNREVGRERGLGLGPPPNDLNKYHGLMRVAVERRGCTGAKVFLYL